MSGEILAYPQQLESERAYLGGIMLVHDRAEQLDLLEQMNPEDYFASSHRLLHSLLRDMARRGLAVDVMTVPEKVMSLSLDQQENMGGVRYLTRLTAMVPRLSSLTSYRKGIQGAAQLRRLLDTAKEIERLAVSGIEPKDALDLAEDLLSRMRSGTKSDEFKLAPELFADAAEDAEARWRALDSGTSVGLSTPWAELNAKISMEPEDLIILAARPGMGKTAAVGNIISHVADMEGPHGRGVAAFNLEMSAVQCAHRFVSDWGSIDSHHITQGIKSHELRQRYEETSERLGDRLALALDDTPGASLARIRSQVRRMDVVFRRQYGRPLGLITVDYLQLMDFGSGNSSKADKVGEVSKGLKWLAKSTGVPVIALSQLNRKCEERADKRPMISDLRDSGAIEQDADKILFLYRDEYYNPTTTADPGVVELTTAKARNGKTGISRLGWQGEYTRLINEIRSSRAYVSGLQP